MVIHQVQGMKVLLTLDEIASLDNPRFVDCRHLLTDPGWGRKQYEQEHLPGAVFAHLDQDLSSPPTGKNGRHPLPPLDEFHSWLVEKALTPDKTIVIYDNFQGAFAARLWWMLTQLYYEEVYIMTNSLSQWKAAGYDTDNNFPDIEPQAFDLLVSSWGEGLFRIKDLQAIALEVPSNYLIDSRAPERYRGEEEPYDAIAGRIPGAVNLYWQSHLTEEGQFKPEVVEQAGIDLTGLKEYTVYCGSGVSAAFNLAVFKHLGLPEPAFYIGSYSEWSQNYPDRIEQDD